MKPEEMQAMAQELYCKKMHCSQAVLIVGLKKIGVSAPEAVKAVGLFAGGIGGSGNICGAMTGGVAAISALFSRSSLEEKENPRMWKINHQFMEKFKELTAQHGGITCQHIAKVNWRNKEQVKEFYGNPESSRKSCIDVVGLTALALGEILERENVK